jgi:hypothetical protein
VVFAHAIADDAGAFARGPVGLEAHLMHRIEDAPMDGLETVADIGEGAAYDDAHGVIEV